MTRDFTPHPHQQDMIDHMLDLPRCAEWAKMGAGKTVSTLTAIDAMLMAGRLEGQVLVVAPKRVALSTWPSEVRKWSHLDLDVSVLIGEAAERRAAMRRDVPIHTINYDNIPWLVETLGDEWPYAMVVADESTRLKGFRLRQGTKRAKMLAKVAHRSTRWVNLTGTPSPNGLKDLWGQTWFLDKGERLGRTYDAFAKRWFRPTFDGFDIEPLPGAEHQIMERLDVLCQTIDPADYMHVDKPTFIDVRVELPGKAMALYKKFEKEMYMELAGNEIEAFNAAAKSMKCMQLANGAVYTDDEPGPDRAWTEVHDAKIQALESVVEESGGEPVLVAYWFKSDLTRLRKAFPKAREMDDNPRTVDDWNAGKIPMLLIHPQSAGHGLNLQDGGRTLVMFSLTWDAELYEQVIERIGPMRQLQSGHPRPVLVYRLVSRGTVDEAVRDRLDTKCSVQQALMTAMKRGG